MFCQRMQIWLRLCNKELKSSLCGVYSHLAVVDRNVPKLLGGQVLHDREGKFKKTNLKLSVHKNNVE